MLRFRIKFILVVAISILSGTLLCLSIFSKEEYVSTHSDKVVYPYDNVIIDPGHGGADGGAVGGRGTLEKDINLSVSQVIDSLFMCTDINAIMTRTRDELLCDEENKTLSKKAQDLSNRVDFTRQYNNALFLSVHQNKFPVSKYKGLQVYYSKNWPESKIIADAIQKNTKALLQNDNNREPKTAGSNIYVLKNAICPAVLVECGFLSNPHEEEMLCDYNYQKKIAICIFSSLMTIDSH